MTLDASLGPDRYLPGHGDTRFDAVHYDLALRYNVDSNRLSGTARIDCVARQELDEFGLDLFNLAVIKVTVDYVQTKHRLRRGKVVIRPLQPIAAGQAFTVRLRYAGHPKPLRIGRLGTAGWEELSDGALVAAQPHGAPTWFPCNDRPSDKATYQISMTAPSNYRVVANGRLVRARRGSGVITWDYLQDEPMAAYLATAHVGRYELVDLDGQSLTRPASAGPSPDGSVPTFAVLPRRLLRQYPVAFSRQPEMLEVFTALFGPYPFGSYTVVITDDDLEIPVEAQGLSTFGANSLRPGWDAERLVAHELSHQWFGNSLTLGQWKDIWLHEGFACYAEWLWSEKSGGRSANEHAVVHHARLAASRQDLVLSDPGPELMFDDRVYKRGALLLHALRVTVDDDCFFGLLRGWTQAHAHSTVTTEAFTRFASTQASTDVTELFDAWLNREALPALPSGSTPPRVPGPGRRLRPAPPQ